MIHWKESDKLCDTSYETLLYQSRDKLLYAGEIASLFLLWIFPLIGSMSDKEQNWGLFIVCVILLITGICIFLSQAQVHYRIKNGDFQWIYAVVDRQEKFHLICDNGIQCEMQGSFTEYKAGTKVIVIQMDGKHTAYQKTIKNKKGKTS